MKRSDLITQAQKIMTRYACRDLEGEERQAMVGMVRRFFSDRVSGPDNAAVMDRMATPMEALAWFNAYLCETFWRRCCSGPMPDTCEMA